MNRLVKQILTQETGKTFFPIFLRCFYNVVALFFIFLPFNSIHHVSLKWFISKLVFTTFWMFAVFLKRHRVFVITTFRMELLPSTFLQTVQGNMPSTLTSPAFSLLIIISVFLTSSLNPFDSNAPFWASQSPCQSLKCFHN